MSLLKIQYRFSAKVWRYAGTNGWYFISLPVKMSKEIRENFGTEEEGWGRLKATARIKNTEWETAIWFDTKKNTYLLPLKSEIRKKEILEAGKNVNAVVFI